MITDPARAQGWIFLAILLSAFVSAYILGKYLTDKWQWGALLGFLYTFSPQYFTYIYGGHEGKMMVFGIAPFAMYSLIRLLREGSLKHAVFLSLSIVWMVLSSHIQLTYFFLWGAGLYTLFELFVNKYTKSLSAKIRIGRLGLAAFALGIALMISAFQILPPYLYTTTDSVRGSSEKTTIEHSASWSLHSEELAAIILPGFLGVDVHKGQSSQEDNSYWGQNPFKLNADACGALLTFLALCGCLLPSNRRSALFWFWGCVIALSYSVGLHSVLFNVWFNIIPGVKNFRAPSMAVFWLPLAFVFLSAPVLKNLSVPSLKELNKYVLTKGALLFGILLLAILISRYSWENFSGAGAAVLILCFGVLFIITQNKIAEIHKTHLTKTAKILWALPFLLLASFFINPVEGDYFKAVNFATAQNLFSYSITSFVITVAVFGVSYFILLNDNFGIGKKAVILLAVAAVDLAVIDLPFVQNVAAIQYYNPKHPVITAIEKDSPNEKERPRVFSLSRNPSVSGNIFSAYDMRNALGFHDNEIATYRIFKEQLQNSAMLDLMNVGYIIFDGANGASAQKNPTDLGRAKLYYKWENVSDDATIIEKLKGEYDYRNTLIIDSIPKILNATQNSGDLTGQVKIINSRPDHLIIEVESSAEGMLFVSENFHKYWNASVNGEPAQIQKAFSTFMAVPVPKDKSIVELRYISKSVRLSLWIGLGGLVLLSILVIASLHKVAESCRGEH
ncbi:hypothetical protein AGMMS49938_15150 [Fibrobacterales bacterium]|nr:hypothetical protein AGMMS49938_15150 [Fibrobacterales bacterium]